MAMSLPYNLIGTERSAAETRGSGGLCSWGAYAKRQLVVRDLVANQGQPYRQASIGNYHTSQV